MPSVCSLRIRLALAVLVALPFAGSSLAQPAASDAASTPASPHPVAAPELPDTPVGRKLRKFLDSLNDPKVKMDEADFAPSFLKQVPIAQLQTVNAQLRVQTGGVDLRSFEPKGDSGLVANIRARTGKLALVVNAHVDDEGRFVGLLLRPAPSATIPALKSFDELDERLGAMKDATVSCAVYRAALAKAGEPTLEAIHEHNERAALALGSTFKLYVLVAMAEAVEAGELTWDHPVTVDEKLKSLPSGTMQNLPDGSKAPLREVAAKMISISDNTATDLIIRLVGRDRVEKVFTRMAESPGRTLPFLTTREMFQVKLSGDLDRARRYADAGVDERRRMLMPDGAIAQATPSLILGAAWTAPVLIDSVEWFASTRDTCAVMARLCAQMRKPGLEPLRDILAINPGLKFEDARWAWIGYKGGSEPGVLNLTWAFERPEPSDQPEVILVSLTFNSTSKAIDQDGALELAQRAVELVWRETTPKTNPSAPAAK